MNLLQDKTVRAFAIAAVLIAVLGMARPKQPGISGLPEELFWMRKMQWRRQFDVAVAGDSRVYRDVAPHAMSRALPGVRIANYGFSGNGFAPEFLDATGQLLDPKTNKPIIVLGLTPHSLTGKAESKNGFLENGNMDPFARLALLHLPGPFLFLNRYSQEESKMLFARHASPFIYYSEFREDGWVRSAKKPEKPMEAIPQYRIMFAEGNGVSERIVSRVMQRIREWTSRGIAVYALRMPASPEMMKLENEMSGYREKDIAARVNKSGGTWLTFDYSKYHTYDGSHLTGDAAEAFSHDLAETIARREQGNK
jgi:hypothetical protein